jgi:hypothetical protein
MQRALTLPAGPTHPRAAAGPPLQEQAAGRSTPETPAACDAAANMRNDAIACVNDALYCALRDVLRRCVAHAAMRASDARRGNKHKRANLAPRECRCGYFVIISLRAIELRAALDAKRMGVK